MQFEGSELNVVPSTDVEDSFLSNDGLSSLPTAGYPFDDLSAEIILRSSDGVHFYVHKAILSYASEVFQGMLRLGQPSSTSLDIDSSSSSSSSTLREPIDMPENAATLKAVLGWCYPIPHSEPTELDAIKTIVGVATKYKMAGVISLMRRPLRDLRETHPLQVFALACTFDLSDLASDSAVVIKNKHGGLNPSWDVEWPSTMQFNVYTDRMASIRAASYLRLLQFIRGSNLPSDFCQPSQDGVVASDNYIIHPIQHADGDLIIRSELNDGIDFRVHRQIISFSSPVLKGMISALVTLQHPSSDTSDTPLVLELPERSAILSMLLTLCYPADDPNPLDRSDPSDIPFLVDTAKKYGVERIIDICQRYVGRRTLTHAFEAYCIAVRCNWEKGARDAAIHLARLQTEEIYHPWMESLDAQFYHALLKFCHQYRRTLSRIPSRFSGTYINAMSAAPGALVQCSWMWSLEGFDFRETAWAVLYTRNNGGYYYDSSSSVSPASHLQNIHKAVVEELEKIQLDINSDWVGGVLTVDAAPSPHPQPSTRNKKKKNRSSK